MQKIVKKGLLWGALTSIIKNRDVYAVTIQTRFTAYFRCSQVRFPCISQRLLTLTIGGTYRTKVM